MKQPQTPTNLELKDKIIQTALNKLRLSLGLVPSPMSETVRDLFRQALEDYSQGQLSDFCDHLAAYENLEDCRFDFMLIDFNDKQK
jgi:hypothetical protein